MPHDTKKQTASTQFDWLNFTERYYELNHLVRVLHLALLHQGQTGVNNRTNEDALASVAGLIDKEMGELAEVFEAMY